MGLIIFMLILFTIFITIYEYIEWICHAQTVKEIHKPYGYASFNTFKKHFDATEWDADRNNMKYCLYKYYHGDCISKTDTYSIRFNDVGMILKSPLSLFRARRYIRKYQKSRIKKEELYKWD